MIWINLLWGLVNLLPIYPLDGGQATQVVLSQVDRRHGVRRAHIVSLVTAGVLAVLAASASRHDYFLAIFFGILAVHQLPGPPIAPPGQVVWRLPRRRLVAGLRSAVHVAAASPR